MYHAAPPTTRPATLHYRLRRTPAGYLALAPAHPPYGPVRLWEACAFLEWRATEDALGAAGSGAFLHAAGASLAGRGILLVGASGAGKSTLAAHLAARGYPMWGDDLVRFAPMTGVFQASDRSWKLDDKSISDIELLRRTCASGALGTLLAPPVWYVSPAAFRAGWRAAPGHVSVVVLLDRARHAGRAAIDRTSEGAAALSVAEALIGAGERPGEPERGRLVLKVLEALQDVSAYEAGGAEPRAVARAMERELAA